MRNKSIRFKLTFWFSLMMVAVVSIAFFAMRFTSGLVLRGTIRDYLISTVEENVDKIGFVREKSDTEANIYIPYDAGFLEIDLDFLDVVNDVHTALYTEDGTMLYGENPLSRQTAALAFSQSHTWHLTVEGLRYDLYDRRLALELPDGGSLWIRGIVPEAKSADQLSEITRLSLIMLPILILLAVLSGYLLMSRLLAPLQDIEATAGRISRGEDLEQRIPVGKSNDEVGRLAAAFNRMLDRLERSFETERQFTSDASHELRTPTAVILAQSEYILEKERSEEEYAEAFQVVQKQGRRMKTLIDDMLDYTRMSQGSERYPLTPTDLSDLTQEAADSLALLGNRGISLNARVEKGIWVEGDRTLLWRLLQNLISNAYRYGKEKGHITVSLEGRESRAELAVSDDGIGIDLAEQERIFDRFYRSDASRCEQGAGLGLAMVKRIAELHGAQVAVESAPGRGSTFRIIFPRLLER